MSISIRRATPVLGICWLVVTALTFNIRPAIAQIDHPIFTEVVVQERFHPQIGQIGSPFITITNPTGQTVDLADFFISNANDGNVALYYYNIVKAEALGAGGGADSLFHCRFPEGVTLAAGDSLVVAINGSAQFDSAYSQLPDFELFEDGTVPDEVPELLPAFPAAIGKGLGVSYAGSNTPHLRSQACLVMYRWDGAADLVQDVDYLLWGGLDRYRVDKTGVFIDGPDENEDLSSYLPDTPLSDQQPAAVRWPTPGFALRRSVDSEGSETPDGGNGLRDHDETSEDLGNTWQDNVPAALPSAPASFFPTAPIVLTVQGGGGQIDADEEVPVTASVIAYGAVSGVTLTYAVDGGSATDLTTADNGNGTWTAVIPGQPEGTEVSWYVIATGENGAVASYPVAAPRFTESYTVGGPPQPGVHPFKLLFSQVCVRDSDKEFIEVYNPSAEDVDLSRYYITDATYQPNEVYYWRIAEGPPTRETVGGGDFADFHAKFPDGFVLAAGDSVAIAVAGADAFFNSYGYQPGLALYEDDDNDNSIVGPGSTPTLTDDRESLIMYYWDSVSDLVTDVDVFVWRPAGTSDSFMFSKTGVTIGGSTYLPETTVDDQTPIAVAHEVGEAYVRIDPNEGNQTDSGSNGVDGRDEVSEDWPNTFAPQAAQPSRPAGSGVVRVMKPVFPSDKAGTTIVLNVPARTFVPARGDKFPIEVVTKLDSETKLRIFNLAGQLVITLHDSRFGGSISIDPATPTTLFWDGRNETFELMPGGMYVVHLSVVKEGTGEEETRTAPVVVATRFD